MLRSIFVLFLFTGPISLAMAQSGEAMIYGQVDTSYLPETNTIYAYTYDDHISFREKKLSKCPLDAKGSFILTIATTQPTAVFITVDNARAEMVVEPGKQYRIQVMAKDSDAVNALSTVVPVEIVFENADKKELNFLIADFTSRYETMLQDYQGNISRKEPAIFKKIDTLEQLFKKKYAQYNNSYLNNYIYYTFAGLEDNLTLENKAGVYKEHLEGKPVLLNDQNYMTFFNQFFSVTANYFMNNPKMSAEVNDKQSFSSILEFTKRSSLLENDTIRETVILKALAEYNRYPEYKTSAVLAVLAQAGTECKAPENRRAAENLRRKLSVMNVGKPVPSMSFQDLEGKPVSLTDLKGKYIYLNFWASWCAPCTQDMTLIPELKKAYGGKIIFVSISVDKTQEAFKNFLKKNPKLSPEKNGAGWLFLYSDNYKKVKEEFNVVTVPTYFLIDPKGNVLRSPAPKPTDIEPELMQIKKGR